MHWTTIYRGHFGEISAGRAKAWEEIIESRFTRRPSGEEMAQAVQKLADEDKEEEETNYGKKIRPGIKQIISAIWDVRGYGKKNDAEEKRAAMIADCKRNIDKMAREKNWLEVWTYVCRPAAHEDCQVLENYAIGIGVDMSLVRQAWQAYLREHGEFRRARSQILANVVPNYA